MLVQRDAPNLQPDQIGDLDPLGVYYYGSMAGDEGRKSHFVAPWVGRPGFMVQQLLNRAASAGNSDVARAARAELRRRSLARVELQWAASGSLPQIFASSVSSATIVGATRDGRCLLTHSRSEGVFELTVWDTETGARLTLATTETDFAAVWAVSAGGATAVSAAGGRVSVWDLRAGEPVGQLAESGAVVTALAVADDGTWTVAADETGGLRFWDLKNKASAPRAAIRPIRHPIARITVFPGERRVLCAIRYGDLEAWSLEGSTQLIRHRENPKPDLGLYSLAVSPDGQRAAYGSFDVHGPRPLGTVTVVDLATGQTNSALTVPAPADTLGCTPLTSVAFLQNGRTLGGVYADAPLPISLGQPRPAMLVGYAHHSTRLVEWELESGRVLVDYTLERGWSGTTMTDAACAFSAAGNSFGFDRVAGWRLEPTRGHSAAVTGVACAEQAARAVSVSRDGTLRIWGLDDKRSTRTLPPEPLYGSFLGSNQKLCVALSADGTRAVTGSHNEHLAVWDLEADEYRTIVPSYPPRGGLHGLSYNPRPAIMVGARGRDQRGRKPRPLRLGLRRRADPLGPGERDRAWPRHGNPSERSGDDPRSALRDQQWPSLVGHAREPVHNAPGGTYLPLPTTSLGHCCRHHCGRCVWRRWVCRRHCPVVGHERQPGRGRASSRACDGSARTRLHRARNPAAVSIRRPNRSNMGHQDRTRTRPSGLSRGAAVPGRVRGLRGSGRHGGKSPLLPMARHCRPVIMAERASPAQAANADEFTAPVTLHRPAHGFGAKDHTQQPVPPLLGFGGLVAGYPRARQLRRMGRASFGPCRQSGPADLGHCIWSQPLPRPRQRDRVANARRSSAASRFLSYTFPSRSPGPAHPAVLNRPDFVEAAPAVPGDPRVRLPPASPRRCDGEEMDGLSPRSGTTAPRGAREDQIEQTEGHG